MQSPVLALLRRLEAQNVWRMTYNVMPQQSFTTAALQQNDEPSTMGFAATEQQVVDQGEWYSDDTLSAQEAFKLLVNRIRDSGPVKQRHLQQLYQRCQSADELEKALRLTRLNYLARGELHQHDPFSHRTSSVLVHEAMRLGAPELAQRALLRGGEFGLPCATTRHFNQLMIYHSKQANLRGMLETYDMMKHIGPRPDSETCFILVKGCVDGGRHDLAELVVSEFDTAGVRVRNGTRLYITQHAGKAPVGAGAAAELPLGGPAAI